MRTAIEHYINQYRYIIQLFADEYEQTTDDGYKMIIRNRSDVYEKALSDMELLLKLCDVYNL